jgi:hypothetical protein
VEGSIELVGISLVRCILIRFLGFVNFGVWRYRLLFCLLDFW